jgi:hypothetical protein
LDPRDPAVFTEKVVSETGIQPAFHLLPPQFSKQLIKAGPFTFGPCIGELANHTDKFSIIRGINMATLTHEVGRRYLITGQPPSGLQARGSSVASHCAHQLGGDKPVPYLAHRVEAYNRGLPAYAAAMPIAAVQHLQFILREDLGIPSVIRPGVKDALHAYWSRQFKCATDSGVGGTELANIYRSNRDRARELVASQLYQNFVFESPELAEVRAHYGFTSGNIESAYGRAALAGQALKTGLSRVVSVALGVQLDTHDNSWKDQHTVRLQEGFNALARLMDDLKNSEAPGGGSMLDKTTIFAFSEFGRTARLNARNGRDHNLCNAAILAGAGVAAGRTIGASSDNGLGPELVDLKTGLANSKGTSLKPEHVLTTVMQCAGLDAAELKSEPIPGLIA